MITPLGPTAWRHAGGLKALAVSPDGRLVAGGGEDLRLWSAEDGALVRCLEWPRGFVHRLAWSADGGRLAAAHGEELDVWSVEGARLWRGALDVAALVADTDGGFLVAAAGERGVSVRRLRADFTSQRIGRIEGKATAVALSVEGGRVAVAHGGERAGEIDLHELPGLGLVRTLTGPAEHVYELSRIDHWEQPYIDRRTEKVSLAALAFDASGATLVSGGNESVIRWWSVARGELIGSVELGDREVGALVFDRAGRTVAVTHHPLVGGPCAARLWELASGALRLLPGRHQRVAAFSGDGARVLVGGSGQRLQTFRTGDGAAIVDPADPGDAPLSVTVVPDTDELVVRTASRLVLGARWQRPVPDQTYAPVAFAAGELFTPDVAAVEDGVVTWGVRRVRRADGETLGMLRPAPTLVWSLATSPDARWLAIGGYERNVAIRELAGGAVRATLSVAEPHAVCFLPSGGGALVADARGRLLVFAWKEAPDGALEPARVLEPATPASVSTPNDEARALAVSADGRHAVSGFNDVVRVWDLDADSNTAGSAPSTRFARVLAVAWDAAPRGLVARPTDDEARGEGTSVELWSPAGAAEIVWSPSRSYLYRVRATFRRDGFALVGDDGVVRAYDSAAPCSQASSADRPRVPSGSGR